MRDIFIRAPVMLLLFCLETGSCQDPVQGFLGQSVLLPCSFRDSVTEKINFYWRDNRDLNVLDIRDGREDPGSQDQKFKGRVSSFPQEFKNGNFSIIMKDLKLEDQNTYECHVPQKIGYNKINTVQLQVSAKPEERGAAGAARRNVVHVFLLSALSLMTDSLTNQ